MNKDHWYIKIYTIIVSYIWYKSFPSCKTRLIFAWNCPKFSNPKILNVQKKKKILFVKTLINTILISNCRRNAVNKSHNNSQNGIWKAILSEIKLQRSLRTERFIHDYWSTMHKDPRVIIPWRALDVREPSLYPA